MVTSQPFAPVPARSANIEARRTAERGAAIFVVVLVLTTLTAIGLFAARITSSVDAATGYARQSIQAQGVSLYAGQLAADILSSQAGIIKNAMENTAQSASATACPANRDQTGVYCAYRTHAELAKLATATSQSLLVAQGATTHGSLGPMHGLSTVAGVEGLMELEFIDVARAVPAPGASMGSNVQSTEIPYEFGLNAWALLRPTITATSDNLCVSDAASTVSNLQFARLYITVPRL